MLATEGMNSEKIVNLDLHLRVLLKGIDAVRLSCFLFFGL